ncbi:MAG: Calx-beta domain-containing protein [Nitrospirota bacterium]
MKIVQSLFILFVVTFTTSVFALDAPVITAAAKGPNQINLTWSTVANPGWGYKVEIQSNGDSRYTNWTELNWKNNFGYLPYWVTETGGTERVYTDPTLASSGWGEAVQSPVYGLRYGTAYNFRVRSYSKTDAGVAVYSIYSNTASATTITPATIRYVTPGGAGAMNGTSWANAWPNINSANGVAAGTLVLIGGGSYALDYIDPSNSGTAGTGRIVFQANYGETVTITSTGGPNSAPILFGTNFVVLDGITTAPATMVGSQPPVMVYGNRNTIAGSSFTGLFQGYSLVEVQGQYNMFYDVFASTVGPNQTDGSTFGFNTAASSYNTIQNSSITRGQHDQILIIYGGDYNRIYNNLIDAGGYGMGFETISAGANNCSYNLFEGNIIKNVATIHNAYKPGFEVSSSDGTFRRNVVYDGWAGSTYYASKGIEVSRLGGGDANNNLIYNNTIVNNGGVGIVFWNGVAGNIIRNNLFYNNAVGYNSEGYEYLTSADANNNTIDHNYFGNPNTLSVIKRSYGNDITVAAADTNYAEFDSNFDRLYTIDFLDYANRELHLRSTSLIRDIGAVVTDTIWGTLSYRGTAPDIGAYEGEGGPPVPTLQFSSATYSVSEGAATATINVTRTGSTVGAVSVSYATSNGTATEGSDYTSASGTLDWPSGDTSAKTITITIINDTVVEGNETVNIALSNANSAQISGTNPVVLTITDNDSTGGDGGNGNSGGDVSGGSGCGYVKDINGKGPRAKGEVLSFMITLIIILTGIALLKKRLSNIRQDEKERADI